MSNLIVVAEESKLLQKMISIALENAGYECKFFDDGKEALDYILVNKVLCIFSNTVLKTITGTELSSVIKNGSKNCFIPFFLYSADEKVSGLTIDNSGATDFFYIDGENFEDFEKHVKSISSEDVVSIDTFIETKNDFVETPAVCAVNAMEKKNLEFLLLDRVFKLESMVYDFDGIPQKILETIGEICCFDAAAIVIKSEPSIITYAVNPFLSEGQFENFLKICRSDYEDKLNISSRIDYKINTTDVSLDFGTGKELKSFESNIIIGRNGELLGTIYLSSCRRNFFNYKTSYALKFFVSRLSPIISNSLHFNKSKIAEDRLRTAFSKFVPEQIIDEMINSDDTTDHTVTEKRKVAILICDIRGFTTLSEINQPEAVVGFLNGYFTRMVDVIKKNGGYIDKYMGDAIMANFGAPISYSDNAKRAVDAAVEMLQILEEIPTEMLTFTDIIPKIEIGIGIHYGDVIAGNIGCKDKTDYTVIGDSVNLASRLEGLTKQYGARIIVSRSVIDGMEEALKKDSNGNELKEVERKKEAVLLNQKYNFIQLDKVKVKGKHQGIDIYRAGDKEFSSEYRMNYEKALSLYSDGNFGIAGEYFKKAQEECKGDKASVLLNKICEDFKLNPPKNWSGYRELTSK